MAFPSNHGLGWRRFISPFGDRLDAEPHSAAFDYHFGALEDKENELMKAYLGLMSDTLGSPSKMAIFQQTMLPIWVLGLMSRFSQSKHLVHARKTAQLANAITRELVDSKAEALLQGKGSKDVLSLLGTLFAALILSG